MKRLARIVVLFGLSVASVSSSKRENDTKKTGWYQNNDQYLCRNGHCYDPADLSNLMQIGLDEVSRNCVDLRDNCTERAAASNGCNSEYMRSYCPVSCQTCHVQVQRYTRPVIHRVKQLPTHRQLLPKVPKNDDDDESNPQPPPTIRSQQQAHKYAGAIPYYNVMDAVGSDLGIPQYLFDDNRNLILDSILKARTYVHDLIDVDNRYRMVRDKCRNKHAIVPRGPSWDIARIPSMKTT
jgi:hypothetical protein